MFGGDGHDGIHVACLAVKMNGQNRPRPRSDGGFDPIRIQGICRGNGFDWNRSRSGISDCQPCGDVSVGGNDHFIPLTYVPCAQNQMHRIQAVADAHAMMGSAIRRVFVFEGFEFLAEHVPSGLHETMIRLVQFGFDFLIG